MNCPQAHDLAAFADGALEDDAARERITDHLSDCDDCRAVVRDDRRLAAAFGDLVCPDAETLGRFIDDALPLAALERTASHVVACDPCQDVVAWTREAQQQSLKRSGKRRRAVAPRGRATTPFPAPALIAGIAAAAALLLVAVLLRQPTPSQQPRSAQKTQVTPSVPTPRVSDVQGKTTASKTTGQVTKTGVAPTPKTDAHPTPTRTPEPSPSATPHPTPSATPSPTPVPTSTTAPTPPPARAMISVAALAAGDLQWKDPQASKPEWRGLDGTRDLPAGAHVIARRPGTFTLGDSSCFLQGSAVVAIAAPDRLRLQRGGLVLDGDPSTTVACGAATVQPQKGGARLFLEAQRGGGYLLAIVAGKADVDVAGSRATVGAGEARLIRKNGLRPVKAKATLDRARAVADVALRRGGIDVPRGVLTARVLRVAAQRLESTSSAQRAQAALVVQSVLLDPRLAHQARPLRARADAALDALGADPSLTRAAAATALAWVDRIRAGTRLTKAHRHTLARLADTIAARDAAVLATDGEALLALRAVERLTRWKPANKKLWSDVASALRNPSDPEALARSLIVKRRPLSPAALKELDALLARKPLEEPLPAASLLAVTQALVLSGSWTAKRERRLLAHAAGGKDSRPERLFAITRHTTRSLGGKVPEAPPSIAYVFPVAADRRVTIIYRPGKKKRPREVYLVGSWDDWREEATPMRRRADGAWTATILLPAGRHEYKLRLDGGKTWELDPNNPLETTDPDGNVNSVLVLD